MRWLVLVIRWKYLAHPYRARGETRPFRLFLVDPSCFIFLPFHQSLAAIISGIVTSLVDSDTYLYNWPAHRTQRSSSPWRNRRFSDSEDEADSALSPASTGLRESCPAAMPLAKSSSPLGVAACSLRTLCSRRASQPKRRFACARLKIAVPVAVRPIPTLCVSACKAQVLYEQ